MVRDIPGSPTVNVDLLKEDTEIFVEKIVDLYLPTIHRCCMVPGRTPSEHGVSCVCRSTQWNPEEDGGLAKQTVRIHSKVVALHFNGDDDGDRLSFEAPHCCAG